MLRKLEYKIRKLQFKINKMVEFWRMYKTYCIFLDAKCDELYKEKYNGTIQKEN